MGDFRDASRCVITTRKSLVKMCCGFHFTQRERGHTGTRSCDMCLQCLFCYSFFFLSKFGLITTPPWLALEHRYRDNQSLDVLFYMLRDFPLRSIIQQCIIPFHLIKRAHAIQWNSRTVHQKQHRPFLWFILPLYNPAIKLANYRQIAPLSFVFVPSSPPRHGRAFSKLFPSLLRGGASRTP